VAEWLYLDWASRAPKPLPDNFVHAEWITLHDNPDFRDFVDFLRAELDRIGPVQADLCRDFSVALSPSNSPFSKPPMPTGPEIDVFDRVKAPEPERDRGFESHSLQRRVRLSPASAFGRMDGPQRTPAE
jgi:hypothetical protein